MSQKQTSNPLMITSNHSYGLSLGAKKLELESLNSTQKKISNTKKCAPKHDLSFLYSRESDRFGDRIEYSDSSLAKVLCEKESLSEIAKRRAEGILASCPDNEKETGGNIGTQEKVNKLLQLYEHNPKKQNPLYTTTSNDIGLKKPSIATFTATRIPRGQKFSNSFNRMVFRDQGLNTSMTQSSVHEQLDP